jgi:hypothetical protein
MIAYALPFIEETHKPLFCEFAVRTQQEEEEGGKKNFSIIKVLSCASLRILSDRNRRIRRHDPKYLD